MASQILLRDTKMRKGGDLVVGVLARGIVLVCVLDLQLKRVDVLVCAVRKVPGEV